MNALGETQEIQILTCHVIKDLLEYRWIKNAGKLHYIGLSIHVVYVLIFNFYVSYFMQLSRIEEGQSDVGRKVLFYFLNTLMALCLIYPTIYDYT